MSPDSCDCILCGDTRIRGSRIKVGRNTFVSLCGDTMIDMRETRQSETSSPPKYHFVVVCLCGNVKLYVPRGTRFTLRRISLCGNRIIEIDDEEDGNVEEGGSQPPAVKLTLVTLCGDVRVEN